MRTNKMHSLDPTKTIPRVLEETPEGPNWIGRGRNFAGIGLQRDGQAIPKLIYRSLGCLKEFKKARALELD